MQYSLLYISVSTHMSKVVTHANTISVVFSILQYYYQGVYSSSQCSSKTVNHAMVVTGYGTTGGSEFWLVKNR